MKNMISVKLSVKSVAVAVLGLGLLTQVGCTKKASLKTNAEKASYVFGFQMGQNVKNQGADINPDSFAMGMSDAVNKKDSQLKPEEMQAAVQSFEKEAMDKRAAQAEGNKKAGDEYLAKNKARKEVKTTASGLQYEVIQEGTGKTPKEDDTVKVHYTGKFITGETFDSSVERKEPATFPVKGVIPGWTEALQLMKEGGKLKVVIPSELAYGAQGRPSIPGHSVLVFDMELLEVVKK